MSFWQEKSLSEMTSEEWESLCDGCARCCLIKLQDEEDVQYTSIVCQYLDQEACQCSDYPNRNRMVPTCVHLTPSSIPSWLPTSCAYRRVDEGKDLEWWHPLVSGSKDSVHDAGISVRGKVISEAHVHPKEAEEQVIKWIEF
ncbi:MAG TPA: YcgN family cysteine cluster protein [Gammaproteobacteria bacterium]|nr:YcgN family cysteine cluster protein [Gammaproteobacteria bacterium]|tara:strand:+ start:550 stop:975 length:426 start_codon:yes stop_codon:yes gene_type:complete